jgi:SAM-dependent methyltransferase
MRFSFGKNWRSFLSLLDEDRVEQACRSLQQSLQRDALHGVRMLDIGSGSGLFSLAAYRLGADVIAFDYDPDSVACTSELRRRFAAEPERWQVLQGSVLDPAFMSKLGQFDLVYSWGVLHHTGEMWRAIDLAAERVSAGGTLLIALYNDQGWRSRMWWGIKSLYCSGAAGRALVGAVFYPVFFLYALALDARNLALPGAHIREYRRQRGMSIFHDWRDWLGGFPFEVASVAAVQERLGCDFTLVRLKSTRGWGCNEIALVRNTADEP